ncbi:hypothetical protein BDP55DRAFT_627044 [Colletotrichum godetiae]|uniref:Uncharacterized protein n=1 Tax=Colletotrichum godetiae TaxID=1209918 RepID=A0AAJ0AVY1_9PEZI|nr:uncharacterized protein BDP55DRAFT_627044 [Colletotrichum godetiae]KAK1691371.1 hypothetical protein BDP55DRAFT_627044 [Colletotrichum godetiae]
MGHIEKYFGSEAPCGAPFLFQKVEKTGGRTLSPPGTCFCGPPSPSVTRPSSINQSLPTDASGFRLQSTEYGVQFTVDLTCHRARILCGNIAPRHSAAHVPLSHALLRALSKPGPGPLPIAYLPTTFPVPLRGGSKHAFLGFNVYCIPALPPARIDTYLLNPGTAPLNHVHFPSCLSSSPPRQAALNELRRTYSVQTPQVKDQTPLACDRTPGQDAKQVNPRSEPIPDRAMLGSDPLPMQAPSHLAAPASQHALTTRLTTSH